VNAGYNYSVSGVLKNAIEWRRAPTVTARLEWQTRGDHGASPGAIGTRRARNIISARCSFS